MKDKEKLGGIELSNPSNMSILSKANSKLTTPKQMKLDFKNI